MPSNGRDIIVIGTSAGGLEALDELIGQLPTDLAAAIFIVQHMAPENTGAALLHRLGRHKAFNCALASDGELFRNGRIYIAPSDNHLLVKKTTLMVTKGARENRYRPAIDPLFRSAAVTHGSGVIGVILTGMLDDGTAGLIAIKKMRWRHNRSGPEGCRLSWNAGKRSQKPEGRPLRPRDRDGDAAGNTGSRAQGQTQADPAGYPHRSGDCRARPERCRAGEHVGKPSPVQLP